MSIVPAINIVNPLTFNRRNINEIRIFLCDTMGNSVTDGKELDVERVKEAFDQLFERITCLSDEISYTAYSAYRARQARELDNYSRDPSGNYRIRENEADRGIEKLLIDHHIPDDWAINQRIASDPNPEEIAHFAAVYGDVETIRAVAEAGADFTTAAHKVAAHGNAETISVVAEAGADFNARDTISRGTAAHTVVAWRPNAEKIRAVAKAGADFNIRDRRGNTPAHLVADSFATNAEAVRAVAEAGTDFTTRNNSGETALSRAAHDVREPANNSYAARCGLPVDAHSKVINAERLQAIAEITYEQAEAKLNGAMIAQSTFEVEAPKKQDLKKLALSFLNSSFSNPKAMDLKTEQETQDTTEMEHLRSLMRESSRILSRAQEQDAPDHTQPPANKEKEAADTSDDFSL